MGNVQTKERVPSPPIGGASISSEDKFDYFTDDESWTWVKKGSDDFTKLVPFSGGGAYDALLSQSTDKNNVSCTGGAEGDTLKIASDYVESLNSKVKDKLIDNIYAVIKELGVPDIKGNTRQEKINSMLDKIPNEKRNGTMLEADAETHKRICMKLANLINKHFNQDIINKTLGNAAICQQVAEFIHSLSSGMHLEFLMVHDSVKRVLKNLNLLKGQLDISYKRVVDKIDKSSDEKLGRSIAKIKDIHNMLLKETDRQINMLTNLLNITILPAEISLGELIKSEKDMFGFIEKLKTKPGSKVFSTVISQSLTGLGLTTSYANIIDVALKKVGITIKEYSEANDMKAFNTKINKQLKNKDFSNEELHEFLQARKLLLKNFSYNKDIGKVLMKGSSDIKNLSKIDKRIKDKKELRSLLFEAFNKQTTLQFRNIVENLNILSNKIGKEVPLSDQLDGFMKSWSNLSPLILRPGMYVALIGYYNDITSRERREMFIAQLNAIVSYIDTIVEMSIYSKSRQYFQDIKNSIKALITTIDSYSDKVKEKFGSSDARANPLPASDVEVDVDIETGEYVDKKGSVVGSADEFPKSQSWRVSKTISDAIKKFKYFYRIAQIRDNLKHAAKEVDHYTTEYEDLRADSIAKKIDAERMIMKKHLTKLNKRFGASDPNTALDEWHPYFAVLATNNNNKAKVETLKENIENCIKKQCDVRIRFWRTIESIDEYMRIFTNNLIKNPDDIKNIKSMLDDTDVIFDWYNNKSGQNIHELFDSFPSYRTMTPAGDVTTKNTGDEYKDSNTKHYYENIKKVYDNGAPTNEKLPGNPYLAVDLFDESSKLNGKYVGDVKIKKAMDNLNVLKNIISVFVNIGSKVGGDVLHKKTFMSPVQIYKNIVDYLECSAFEMGYEYQTIEIDLRSDDSMSALTTQSDYKGVDRDADRKLLDTVGLFVGGDVNDRIATDLVTYKLDAKTPNAVSADNNTINAKITDIKNKLAAVNDHTSRNLVIRPVLNAFIITFNSAAAAGAVLDVNKRNNFNTIYKYFNGMVKNIDGTDSAPNTTIAIFKDLFQATTFGTATSATNAVNDLFEPLSNAAYLSLKSILKTQHVEMVAAKLANANTNIPTLVANSITVASISNISNILSLYQQSISVPEEKIRVGFAMGKVNNQTNDMEFDLSTGSDAEKKIDYMNTFGVYMRSVIPGLDGGKFFQTSQPLRGGEFYEGFKDCDEWFVRIMKAMCAKIFTVVGMVDVFNRPDEALVMNPVRMILGAGDTPQVEDKAVELYLRLPLLAEFYRELFGFNKDDPNTFHIDDKFGEKISMLPEMDGIFNNFIKLIFKKNKDIKVPDYSDDELKELFKEINIIYSKLAKNPETAVLDVIREFRDEVNRRYGLIKKKDRDMYQDEFGYRYDYAGKAGDDSTLLEMNIPLLPGEEDSIYDIARPSPSARYETTSGIKLDSDKTKRSKNLIKKAHHQLFYRFMCKIDNYFKKQELNADGLTGLGESKFADSKFQLNSFQTSIKTTQKQLSKETNKDKRFKLIVKLVRNTNKFGYVDNIKYFMFHETVIVGLNTLSGIHTLLDRFQKIILILNKDSRDFLNSQADNVTKDNTIRALKEYLVKKYYRAGGVGETQILMPDFNINGNEVLNDAVANTKTVFSKNIVFKALIESLLAISDDLGGLVKLNIDDQKIMVSFSELKSYVEKIFSGIRYFMEKFRPHIEKNIFNKYIAKNNPGSYYWLQEQLMEKMFVGRPSKGAMGDDDYYPPYTNMDQLNLMINDILEYSTLDVDISNQIKSLITSTAQIGAPTATDITILNSVGINRLQWADDGKTEDGKLEANIVNDKLHGITSSAYGVGAMSIRHDLISRFNQLLFSYLNMAYDETSRKIYLNIFDKFANGEANSDLLNDAKMLNDSAAIDANTLLGGNVLMLSIGRILRNALTSKHKSSGEKIYTVDNITEVSTHTKEKYRAYLPVYKNLFKTLLNKATTVKKILTYDNNTILNKETYVKIIDKLIRYVSTLLQCIEQVHRELGDSPKYLELHQGSLNEYKTNHGKYPITPISTMLFTLANDGVNAVNAYSKPFSSPGDPNFKFAYGTRLTLAQPDTKLLPQHAPGYEFIIDTFNSLTESRNQLDKVKVGEFFRNITYTLRFLHDVRHYKSLMVSPSTKFTITHLRYLGNNIPELIGNRLNVSILTGPNIPENQPKPIYGLNARSAVDKTSLNDVLSITENNMQDISYNKIIKHLDPNEKDEESEPTIRNLLDLNLPPINIHAMMREMPMVPLYEYEWTFDRMIIELFYGINNDFANQLILHMCSDNLNRTDITGLVNRNNNNFNIYGNTHIRSSKEMFIALLLNPYRKILSDGEIGMVERIFRGDSNLGLGRPKFLGDQLYNKALFGELYNSSENYDEVGPLNTSLALPNDSTLTYLTNTLVGNKKDNKDKVFKVDETGIKSVQLDEGFKKILGEVGKLRLHTRFIRNLMFLTNLYRCMRLKLRNDLMHDKGIIVKSHIVTRSDNTEFKLNQTVDDSRTKINESDWF